MTDALACDLCGETAGVRVYDDDGTALCPAHLPLAFAVIARRLPVLEAALAAATARLAAAETVVEAVRAWANDPFIPGEPEDAYWYRELAFEDAMVGALETYDDARPDAGATPVGEE